MQQFGYLCKLELKIAHSFYSRVVTFWGRPPQTDHRGFAPGLHWGLKPPDPHHLLPLENISGYEDVVYDVSE